MSAKNYEEILRRFQETYTFYTPVQLTLSGTPSDAMRVIQADYLVSADGDRINVSLVPFGEVGRIPRMDLPEPTFEGLPVSYHLKQDVPLSPEDHVLHEFIDRYSEAVGTIEGMGDATFLIGGFCFSGDCDDERSRDYGCPPGEFAILSYAFASRAFPPDPERTYPVGHFPRRFRGLNVYYKQNQPIRAL